MRRQWTNSGGGVPKNLDPPQTPPLQLGPYIYKSIALDLRIQIHSF